MQNQKTTCPDCGPSTVNHFLSKTILIIDWTLSPVNGFFMSITKTIINLLNHLGFRNIGINFFVFLSKVGLAQISEHNQEDNSDRTKCLWEAAEARGIKMYQIRILDKPTELFWSEKNHKKLLFECLPRPLPLSEAFYWMDDKGAMRKKFAEANLPIGIGEICFTYKHALEVLKKVNGSVITKPNVGSRSRHTTIHISNPEMLKKAFKIAKKLSPWVIVEQELKGTVYRVTLIGGELAAVMRRDPPFVIGDGISNLKELVLKENQNPKRHGPHFHEIPIDNFTDEEIARQGLTWNTIPENGKMIIVRNNIGRSSGGSNSDITDKVHPENKKLFEKIAKVVGDPIIGMDFIIEDMNKSWTEQYPCGAIELNSVPFLDLHHFPLYGNAVDASGKLWDFVYRDSSSISMSPK
ncbi:MAG: Cyanophycin synthase [Candidatus Doudnabacteria bacterium]|nr:Cyanophycin synthase [Candidatus Doudnabacteria bacterium]